MRTHGGWRQTTLHECTSSRGWLPTLEPAVASAHSHNKLPVGALLTRSTSRELHLYTSQVSLCTPAAYLLLRSRRGHCTSIVVNSSFFGNTIKTRVPVLRQQQRCTSPLTKNYPLTSSTQFTTHFRSLRHSNGYVTPKTINMKAPVMK